jgi:flagellar export protein FliJ
MRRFVFPLERVLDWRRMRAELERLALERLVGEQRRLEEEAAALAAAVEESRGALSRRAAAGEPIEAAALAALEEFAAGAKMQQEALRSRQAELAARVEAQRKRLAVARRDLRLIEKLRERARSAWELEYARELEKLASELYLARWGEIRAGR